METTKTYSFDAAKNIVLSFVICFVTGSLYSLGVFSTFIEDSARLPGSLNGVWSAGMAFISFFCMPLMFFTGVYISEGTDSAHSDRFGESKSSRIRILTAWGSLFYGLLAIAGFGVSTSSAFLIQLSLVPVGCAMGLFYVESMELLSAWVPHHPGFAIGIGQMMFGFGSIISSSIFKYLVQHYSTPNALYITAAFMSLPTAAATPFLQWPSPNYRSTTETSESHGFVQHTYPLSWKRLVHLSSFWMYVTTIFCLQMGYAFIGYYFKIGETFDRDVSTLVTSFQAANVAGTLLRPLTGALVDILKKREGFFSLGSKNMILILFLGQAVCFLGLPPASWTKSYPQYAIFAGTSIAIFAAGSCCAPLLAREQFGTINSSVVFGVGGSISMGLGETLAIAMMATVEWTSSKSDGPSAYQGYYLLSLLFSVTGFAIGTMLKAQAFDNESPSEFIESGMNCHLEIAPSELHKRSNSFVMSGCHYYGAVNPPFRTVKVS